MDLSFQSSEAMLALSARMEQVLNGNIASRSELMYLANSFRLFSLVQSVGMGLISEEEVKKSAFFQNTMETLLKPKKR